MIASILASAWRRYRERFGTIAAIVVTIWLPCELVDSYCTYFVFDPDDLRASFKLTQFLDHFIGIISTAGVTYLVLNQKSDRPVGYGESLGMGSGAWGRMWVTRFLYSIAVLLGLLLLIIPGLYVGTRLAFAEAAVVAERASGPDALRSSWELTRGRFWPVFGLLALTIALVGLPVVLLSLPTTLIPDIDHWLVNAVFMLLSDVIVAFATVVIICGYEELDALSTEPPALPAA